MSKPIHVLLSGVLLSIPALLYLGFHLLTSQGEYYYVTYLAQGIFSSQRPLVLVVLQKRSSLAKRVV